MSSITDNSTISLYSKDAQNHMFLGLKVLQDNTGISASESAKKVFKYAGNDLPLALPSAAMFIVKLPICEERLTVLLNRPKKGREVGRCLDNSVSEMTETGNRMACGYDFSRFGSHIMMTFHFFNIDADGNAYDTEDRIQSRCRTPLVMINMTSSECARFVLDCCKGGRFHGDTLAIIGGSVVYDYQAFLDPDTGITHFTKQPFGHRRKGIASMSYAGSFDGNTETLTRA